MTTAFAVNVTPTTTVPMIQQGNDTSNAVVVAMNVVPNLVLPPVVQTSMPPAPPAYVSGHSLRALPAHHGEAEAPVAVPHDMDDIGADMPLHADGLAPDAHGRDAEIVLTFDVQTDDVTAAPHDDQDSAAEHTSLPPSEIIRAINEGSIALRIRGAAAPAAASPIWLFDEVTGTLQQPGSGTFLETIRLDINEPTDDDQASMLNAADQYGSFIGLNSPHHVSWHEPSWLKFLKDVKNRWL
jgi:hypothetical protein